VWIRRVVGASAAAKDANAYNVTAEGDSAE
jgi:hypothetical protein